MLILKGNADPLNHPTTIMSETFNYLLIPADPTIPIQTFTASKSGGLSDDELQKAAKQYFYERSDKKARQGEIDECCELY